MTPLPAVGLLEGRAGLRPSVAADLDGEDLVLDGAGRVTRLRGLPVPVREHLAGNGATVGDDLPDEARRAADALLGRLAHLATNRLTLAEHEVMRHEGTTRATGYTPHPPSDDDVVRLDRFALLRSREDQLVLECPRSVHRFVLTSPEARSLAAEVAVPRRVGDLPTLPGGLAAAELLGHWAGAGLLERADADGTFRSDTDEVLRQWDFHDLLMHSRSRSGRWDEPLGALSPHRGLVDPLPAVTDPRPECARVVALPDPPPWSGGLSLADAVRQRRSVRDYADAPVTLVELATFLHRSFRDRARFDPPVGSAEESKVSRPYPSGGGLYEHELYLTVRRCDGLDPGVYHYDALRHRLELVDDDPEPARAMLAVAAAATGHPSSPDVLLTLTARFQRMSWRYRSIAYANVLRTTGAIYQTMYLVATDLDLAPCALGNGDADLSARVLGLDWLRESSVGDFVLGRRDAADVVAGEPLAGWTVLGSGDPD
ncbi:SagB family peptide dehydrogenase [Phycicoccus sp. BSK3Z-2]|uniref:SagB family peptide dehydrogenase n=1 Tax=Phycicoccus avicenniae TaxID=2828860 RepID=A0A941D5K2_9MICO|nr:SagB family peptide dehydrogenase [Phycicoccus avicenniae]MBR7742529.1 SagB family peptide dehydrogenase [Phycicoccus avicenniae]